MQRGVFATAALAAGRALIVARNWGDEQWVAKAEAQIHKVHETQEEHDQLALATRTLAARPQDPQANLTLGIRAALEG